jgi:hypothetical protein
MAGQKKCKTDAEIENFTKIKDEKKKEFDSNLASRMQMETFN